MPIPLSELDAAVEVTIREHGSITRARLVSLLAWSGYRDRAIRRAIQRLVTDKHIPIGSTSRPGGYYWIDGEAGREIAYKEIMARVMTLLARAHSLRDKVRIGTDIQKQLSLFNDPTTQKHCD